MSKKVQSELQKNREFCEQLFCVSKSFDLIERNMIIGGKNACFYFIDGMIKDEVMQKIMDSFYGITKENMAGNVSGFIEKCLPYVEVGSLTAYEQMGYQLFSGVLCLFIDGYDQCITIDCRTYPARGVEEPAKDKVLRGSKDGFVETVIFNTALIRRRIRSASLRIEMKNIGCTSRTDVVLCYMEDRVDQKLLQEIQKRMDLIQVDALTMNQESLAECLYKKKWYNPFPKFKYTERPDTAAACILEGNIVVLVDNSPSAMIIPTSIFDILEEADDYYFPPITGTYLRLSRFVIALITLLLTPTFLLLMNNKELIPTWLTFIVITEQINIPIIIQFLMLELAVDGLKLAALNTPSMLSTPLSIIAALVLGEFSVNSGWFNSEVMLYMAFVALANYTQASLELGYALKFMRIWILVLTAIGGKIGYILGIVTSIGMICFNKTVAGKSYIYPLIPFDPKQFVRRFFRVRIDHSYREKK